MRHVSSRRSLPLVRFGRPAVEDLVWVGAVLLAWIATVAAYAPLPAHGADPSYLAGLERFAQGLEAPRPLRQLSWGLLHLLGHGLDADGGSLGRGWGLLGTLVVPLAAATSWRLARAVGAGADGAALAAVAAAWLPHTAWIAGSVDSGVRWLGVAVAWAAVAVGCDAIRSRGWSAVARAVLLCGGAAALHPAGSVAVALGLPLWVHAAAAAPDAGGRRPFVGALLMGGATVAAATLLLAGSSLRSGHVLGSPGELVAWALEVPAAHGIWALPSVGALAPQAGAPAVGLFGLALAVALTVRSLRPLGLLLLASLAGFLPELGAVGTDPQAGLWTGNAIRATAATALAVAAVVGVGAGAAVEQGRRRGGSTGGTGAVVLSVLAIVVLSAPRFGQIVGARAEAGRADLGHQIAVAEDVVIAAAAAGESPSLAAGAPPEWRRGSGLKRNPEASAVRSADPRSAVLDPALERLAALRCDLWLGAGAEDRCWAPIESVGPQDVAGRCAWDEGRGPACPAAPPPASAASTRDPRATPWALACLALLAGCALAARSGASPGSSTPADRSSPLSAATPRAQRFAIAAAGLGIGVALVFAEVAARWVHAHAPAARVMSTSLYVACARAGYRLAPDERDAEWCLGTNSHGLRDRARSNPAPGPLRVFVLGDSFLAGVGVADDEHAAFLAQEALSGRLGRGAREVEVWNLAVPHYSTEQQVLHLAERVDALGVQPDVIVLGTFIGNDLLEDVRGPGWFRPVPGGVVTSQTWWPSPLDRFPAERSAADFPPFAPRVPGWRGLSRRSYLARLGARATSAWLGQARRDDPRGMRPFDYAAFGGIPWIMQDPRPAPLDVGWQVTRAAAADLAALAEGWGARVLVAPAPTRFDVDDDAARRALSTGPYGLVDDPRRLLPADAAGGSIQLDPDRPWRDLRGLADELSWGWLDVRPRLRAAGRRGAEPMHFVGDTHWTPGGHREYAGALLVELSRRGWIPRSHPGMSDAALKTVLPPQRWPDRPVCDGGPRAP